MSQLISPLNKNIFDIADLCTPITRLKRNVKNTTVVSSQRWKRRWRNPGITIDSPSQLVHREKRDDYDDVVSIHYGLIASANASMKDANVRDKLANNEGVLCFKREAAGLMNHFPCLVIRGICDYSDSHKNEKWQGFAAMAASVYAKQLLSQIAPTRLEMQRKMLEDLDNFQDQMQRTESGLLHVKGILENNDRKKWLDSPDPSINFNDALQQQEQNTGLWFLNSEPFASWKVESKSFLWLHGIPGLLINGADTMIQNSHGWIPLHAASFRGWTEISGLLREQGININMGNKDGWTALQEASHHGHLQTVILLLEKGAEIDSMDHVGRTPLHLAIHNGQAEVTKYLLKKGADVTLVKRL